MNSQAHISSHALKYQRRDVRCHIRFLNVLKKNISQSKKYRSLIQSSGRYFCRQQCVLAPPIATAANESYSQPCLLLYVKIKKRVTDVTSWNMLRNGIHKYIKWSIDLARLSLSSYRLEPRSNAFVFFPTSSYPLSLSPPIFVYPSLFLLVFLSVFFWNPVTFIQTYFFLISSHLVDIFDSLKFSRSHQTHASYSPVFT